MLYHGLAILGGGSILAGVVLGAIAVFIIDRKFIKAAGFAARRRGADLLRPDARRSRSASTRRRPSRPRTSWSRSRCTPVPSTVPRPRPSPPPRSNTRRNRRNPPSAPPNRRCSRPSRALLSRVTSSACKRITGRAVLTRDGPAALLGRPLVLLFLVLLGVPDAGRVFDVVYFVVIVRSIVSGATVRRVTRRSGLGCAGPAGAVGRAGGQRQPPLDGEPVPFLIGPTAECGTRLLEIEWNSCATTWIRRRSRFVLPNEAPGGGPDPVRVARPRCHCQPRDSPRLFRLPSRRRTRTSKTENLYEECYDLGPFPTATERPSRPFSGEPRETASRGSRVSGQSRQGVTGSGVLAEPPESRRASAAAVRCGAGMAGRGPETLDFSAWAGARVNNSVSKGARS